MAAALEAESVNTPAEALQALMRQAALILELPDTEVRRAAEEARVNFHGIEVSIGMDADETALVISADAGAATLETLEQQRTALQCALPLMAYAGMTIGFDHGQAVLSCRLPLDDVQPQLLAASIFNVVMLSGSMREEGVALLEAAMTWLTTKGAQA
jgi:hypothetical protein